MLTLDWPSFREETKGIIIRLRARVRDETDLIYPLATQKGLIPLRERSRVPAGF